MWLGKPLNSRTYIYICTLICLQFLSRAVFVRVERKHCDATTGSQPAIIPSLSVIPWWPWAADRSSCQQLTYRLENSILAKLIRYAHHTERILHVYMSSYTLHGATTLMTLLISLPLTEGALGDPCWSQKMSRHLDEVARLMEQSCHQWPPESAVSNIVEYGSSEGLAWNKELEPKSNEVYVLNYKEKQVKQTELS